MKRQTLTQIKMQLAYLSEIEIALQKEVKKQQETTCLSEYDRLNMVEVISILESDLIVLSQQKQLLNGASKLKQKNLSKPKR